MLRKVIFQIVAGILVISAAVVIIRGLPALRSISDAEADAIINGVSVLLTAQYNEIKEHFPEQAAAIRDEAKRLEQLDRRGFDVAGGALVTFTRRLISPNVRAIRHASEEAMDLSLGRILANYEIFRGDPVCGSFLLSGTSVLSRESRQQIWLLQAEDMPIHFDAIVEGLTYPKEHTEADVEAWSELYKLHVARGNARSEVETFRAAASGAQRQQLDMEEFCDAFLNIGKTLVGSRFPGSAAIKANQITLSFGIAP